MREYDSDAFSYDFIGTTSGRRGKGESMKAIQLTLIMLLLAIFTVVSYFIVNTTMESKNVYTRARNSEKELASLQRNLEKTSGENIILNKNTVRLEKKVGDLAAQKELFTSVIESLTQKSEETKRSPRRLRERIWRSWTGCWPKTVASGRASWRRWTNVLTSIL